jgi:hypothetical protein
MLRSIFLHLAAGIWCMVTAADLGLYDVSVPPQVMQSNVHKANC